MSGIKAALKAEIEKMESFCDEIPFGLCEEDEALLGVLRGAAEALVQRDAQIAALTAENVTLKESVEHAGECISAAEFEGLSDALESKDGEKLAELIHRRLCHAHLPVETPATDAAANALRAEGVEMFGQWQRELAIKATGEVRCAYVGSVKDAITFANQLREGK